MPEKYIKGSRKKIFLFGALIVDIMILSSLLILYYTGNREVFTLIECNNMISFGNCPVNGDVKTVKITPTSMLENLQSDESVLLTVKPSSVNTYLSNPGIGWQHDIHGSSDYLPETVAYSNRQEIGWMLYPWPVEY